MQLSMLGSIGLAYSSVEMTLGRRRAGQVTDETIKGHTRVCAAEVTTLTINDIE